MTRCAHSNLSITAAVLDMDGEVSAYDAVYKSTCPFCGAVKRDTRLAVSIHELRRSHGWGIETVRDDSGSLAKYVVMSRGRTPAPYGDPKVPHVMPRPLTGKVTVEHVPTASRWACAECGAQVTEYDQPLLGGFVLAACMTHGYVPHRPLVGQARQEVSTRGG